VKPQDFPPSPVLTLTGLDEAERTEDLDGDNWPITWADDDALYAAYGDGWGCRPVKAETKRNTGLVLLRGTPSAPAAEEVPCPWFGGGAQDPNLKGCGLLSADGVLYHFLRYQVGEHGSRHQIASRLIWSRDHGTTWEGATDYGPHPEDMSWFFTEPDHAFHSPTFLQAGRDYREAPDEYVYVYSPNEDARRANNGLVLARVRRDRVQERAAYRFFAGLGGDGRPVWAENPAVRQPVLECPGHVSCGDVVYLPPCGGSCSSPAEVERIHAAASCSSTPPPRGGPGPGSATYPSGAAERKATAATTRDCPRSGWPRTARAASWCTPTAARPTNSTGRGYTWMCTAPCPGARAEPRPGWRHSRTKSWNAIRMRSWSHRGAGLWWNGTRPNGGRRAPIPRPRLPRRLWGQWDWSSPGATVGSPRRTPPAGTPPSGRGTPNAAPSQSVSSRRILRAWTTPKRGVCPTTN
jgi:hypothetical protein